MIGLFQELGPCKIDSNLRPYDNPNSWTNVTNMLFIDQPTQVGFSYSVPAQICTNSSKTDADPPCPSCSPNATKCGTWSRPDLNLTAHSTIEAAPGFWKTMQGFMGAFPQYSQKKVILASESFGGHYGPVYSSYILEQNKKATPGTVEIPLAALFVGNGWHDPLLQFPAYFNFTTSLGNTYDLPLLNESTRASIFDALYKPGGCIDRIRTCYTNGTNEQCSTAGDVCYDGIQKQYEKSSGRDTYDIRYLNPSPFPPSFFIQYLNTPKVQKAIGAHTNFSKVSQTVLDAFLQTGDDARGLTGLEDMRNLVRRGVSVTLYYGDSDFLSNWMGGEAVADALDIDGYDKAGYVDIQSSDRVVHGQVKQAGLFSFVRVYESGHMVPIFQPLLSLEMLQRVSLGLDIATGNKHQRDSFTKGLLRSSFREGNGTVQWKAVPENATYNVTTNKPNV